ncbi:MAG: dihydrofolate reductase [Bacteroidetes bacterium]|nr:MAG: dihydrofolate reductase [Bacteroidota bacterium]REK00408.1 MAG: dihydrofolate reductase [Bacteroidota bacterium]REK35527.1 MAG: dihydrofolate reductase [Bacteroidota bacterium]
MKQALVSVIVALSENNVVGVRNQLPWKLSADLKRVKALTMGHHILMGRKTFESIGKALPGRTNVVITRNEEYRAEGCVMCKSLKEAINHASSDTELFIFGGGEIFQEAIPLADKIYMTRVHTTIQGDTYFPELNPEEWTVTESESFSADEKNEFDYSFITMERVIEGK